MQVLLDAIERAGGPDRGRIAEELFETNVQDGILGTFEITAEGDPTAGPITVYEAAAEFEPAEVITPAAELVQAAMGG